MNGYQMIKSLCLCFFLFLFQSLQAEPYKQNNESMMLHAIDIIKYTLHVGYAPAEWKDKWHGWNLDSEAEKSKMKIRGKNLSVKEFQQVLKEFLYSTKDYHVGITFFSTEHAYLPFRVKGANGKYFITYIDRETLPVKQFPFHTGDELVAFDGVETKEAVDRIRERDIGSGNEETDLLMAAFYLTNRDGSLGHLVPKGEVDLEVKSKATGKILTHTLVWNYFPEKISAKHLLIRPFEQLSPRELLLSVVKREFLYHRFNSLKCAYERKGEKNLDPDEMGGKKGFIPFLGRTLWVSDKFIHFHAYIFESPSKKKIGFIRIPTYMGSDEEADEFCEIIRLFQRNTDALIIDQVNNPGGYLFYLYSISSMLTDVPMHSHKHKINITQKDVMLALTLMPVFDEIINDEDAKSLFGDTLDGIQVNMEVAQSFQTYFKYVISEWEKGKTLMDPCHVLGLDKIYPNKKGRYTKPLLVLTNGLDFSSADFFPALMQDNMRAKILGTKTAGAGGIVLETAFPNLLGIEYYHYTGSIAERKDLSPIENLGVTPDILYEITENDIQYNYPGYVSKILETIEEMTE